MHGDASAAAERPEVLIKGVEKDKARDRERQRGGSNGAPADPRALLFDHIWEEAHNKEPGPLPPIATLVDWANSDGDGAPRALGDWLGISNEDLRLAIAGLIGVPWEAMWWRSLYSIDYNQDIAALLQTWTVTMEDVDRTLSTRLLTPDEKSKIRDLLRIARVVGLIPGIAQHLGNTSSATAASAGDGPPALKDGRPQEDDEASIFDSLSESGRSRKKSKGKKAKSKKDKDRDKRKKKKRKRSSSSSSSSNDVERVEYAAILDQSKKGKFKVVSSADIAATRRSWSSQNHSREEKKEQRASVRQISSVLGALKRDPTPYMDPGIWRPFGEEMEEDVTNKKADALRNVRLAGPQGWTDWQASWVVYACVIVGIMIASVPATDKYSEFIAELAGLWKKSWPLILRADRIMRRFRFPKYVADAQMDNPSVLVRKQFRNQDASMEYCLEQAILDTRFWNDEVIVPTQRIAQGIITLKEFLERGYGSLTTEALPSLTGPGVLASSRPSAAAPADGNFVGGSAPVTRGANWERNQSIRAKKKQRMQDGAQRNQWQQPVDWSQVHRAQGALPPPPPVVGQPAIAATAASAGGKGGKAAGKGSKAGKDGKGAKGGDRICRQWAATRTCSRGPACWFAASHV